VSALADRVAATRWCHRPETPLLEPPAAPPLRWRSYVRVLAERGERVEVAALAAPEDEAGPALGWVAAADLSPLVRPARPSRADAQRAALLAQARAAAGEGAERCYEAVAAAIHACGGYGDLLDLEADERFASGGGHGERFAYRASARAFVDAVADAGGAARLGLRELALDPLAAPAGALLVTQHNGHPACPIHPTWGDIAVLGELEGGGAWHRTRRAAPLRDEVHDPTDRSLPAGAAVEVLERSKLPGRPLCARTRAGWVALSALEPLPRRRLAYNDGVLAFPGDPRRYKSAAWAGAVLGIYAPLDRAG